MRLLPAVLSLLLASASPGSSVADGPVADGMPAYVPMGDVSATLRVRGSDTLRTLLEAWSRGLAAHHPQAGLDVESKGSATAPPALAAGTADLAAMSRPMTPDEIAAVEAARGHRPVPVTVALDAIAVVVHPDNPVQGLTMDQLDGLFSSTHLCGGRNVVRWDQLVVGAPPAAVALHGRNSLSGTYATFRERALCDGAFKESVVVHDDTRGVVDAVAADPGAIGYVGLGYRTDAVRAVALGVGQGFEETRYVPFVVDRYRASPDPALKYAYVFDGRYPLARPLLLYVDKTPGEALPAAVEAFLGFVLSAEGQRIVEATGFVPLSPGMVAAEREKLAAGYAPRRSWLPWN